MPDYPEAPPKIYYRLTKKGIEAPDHQWSNPQLTLYPERGLDYYREKRAQRKYAREHGQTAGEGLSTPMLHSNRN
jgi:DNA-binding PadR family transcriptional regulator